MQVPVTTLNRYRKTLTGTAPRQREAYVLDSQILGVISGLSLNDYKRYMQESTWKLGNSFILYTQANLNIGDVIKDNDRSYLVLGEYKGVRRNAYILDLTEDI